jgi:hypothetical protein
VDRGGLKSLVKDDNDRIPNARVGILGPASIGAADVSDRWRRRSNARLGFLPSGFNGQLGAGPVIADRVQAEDAPEEEAVGVGEVDELVALSEKDIMAMSSIDEVAEVQDVPREARDIGDGDETDLTSRHPLEKPVELVSRSGPRPGDSEVSFQRIDHAGCPAPRLELGGEVALDLGAADVGANLFGRGLADVDDGAPPEMAIGDLRWPRDHGVILLCGCLATLEQDGDGAAGQRQRDGLRRLGGRIAGSVIVVA